jgi:hypothetical protein
MYNQNEKKSIFEYISFGMSRNISSKNKTNVESFPPSSLECRTRMQEQINLVLKEVMYNSVAQAIIKIFQTPHLTLKVTLTLFVLLAISIR